MLSLTLPTLAGNPLHKLFYDRRPWGQAAPPGEFLGPGLQQKLRPVRVCCTSHLWS